MTLASPIPDFDERLRVPLWWWPIGVGMAGLFAAELHGGVPGLQAVLPYLILLPGSILVLAAMSRSRVQVAGGDLVVPGGRHLPVAAIAGARGLGPEGVRALLAGGPGLVVARRPWVATAVHLTLTDGSASWLVSTGRPDELVSLLTTGVPPAG